MAINMYHFREKIISLQQSGENICRLDVGEPEPEKREWVLDIVSSSLKDGIRYGSSYGNKNLIERICRKHNVESSNVIIGPGSKFIIYALIKIFGKGVSTLEPAWPAYRYMASDLGLDYEGIKTEIGNHWQPKLEELGSVRDRTMIINTPSNPTSTKIHDLEGVCDTVLRNGNNLVMDLAYSDLSFLPFKEPKFGEGIYLVYTMSKARRLSGWRVGYALVPGKIKEKYDDFVSITINNVPDVCQEIAAKVFDFQDSSIIDTYREMADYSFRAMSDAGFRCARPDAGFYLFVEVGDGNKVAMNLLDHGFAVMPGSIFGEGYGAFIRFYVPDKKDIIDNLLSKLMLVTKK